MSIEFVFTEQYRSEKQVSKDIHYKTILRRAKSGQCNFKGMYTNHKSGIMSKC